MPQRRLFSRVAGLREPWETPAFTWPETIKGGVRGEKMMGSGAWVAGRGVCCWRSPAAEELWQGGERAGVEGAGLSVPQMRLASESRVCGNPVEPRSSPERKAKGGGREKGVGRGNVGWRVDGWSWLCPALLLV